MENVANVVRPQPRDLPAEAGAVPGDHTLTVSGVLTLPSFAGAQIVAGRAGLEAAVRSVNVMEVPDILPWVKAGELLLTTGFPLRHSGEGSGAASDPSALAGLVDGLAQRGVSALCVKRGRYLDELPPEMLGAAERRGFPLLLLSPQVAFDDVMSEVFGQLVDRQARALDVADRVHRTLTALVLGGGDLPQIAAEFGALFEAAVLICSPDGRVHTAGGSPEQGARLAELDMFDASGRFRVERVRPGLQAGPHERGQMAIAPVIAGGTDHGLIVAYSGAPDLGAACLQALERAATVAALAITKQLAVAAVESKFRGDFLRDALAGSAGTPEQVKEHCAQLGWDLDRPLAVVVVRLDGEQDGSGFAGLPPLERLTAAWQQVMRGRDRAAPVIGFSHELVALVPATRETVERVVAEVVTAVTGDRGGGRRSFSTGVSRVIDSVGGLPAGYEQAGTAVRVGRRMNGPGSVAHFDALGVHRVLSLVSDPEELRSFAAEVLGPLGMDLPDALDLRGTLQELLDRNCNVAETARALHFHYNTLRYRISKLESMVGPFTQDANLRLDVALALRVVQMRGL
ncbi:MAG: PucR family transcriptional regulator [Jatrophihabitans sp.]|nr:MAG: PucR family transcriptional regulator [Jatrophihabitans sp.]